MLIEDGKGSGYKAAVNDKNHLRVSAITETKEHNANHDLGQAYSAVFAVNPDGADDVIFYLKNNSDDDCLIEGITWQTSAAEEVYYKLGDTGTAVATSGATITPINLNGGSGNAAEVTCISNISDGAVDITGLTGGSVIEKLWLTSAASVHFNLEQDVVVPKNSTFTIYAVGGDTLLRGTVSFHFSAKAE